MPHPPPSAEQVAEGLLEAFCEHGHQYYGGVISEHEGCLKQRVVAALNTYAASQVQTARRETWTKAAEICKLKQKPQFDEDTLTEAMWTQVTEVLYREFRRCAQEGKDG